MRIQVTLAGEEIGIFDPDELDVDQAMQLEDKTGMTVQELGEQLARGSARAMQALVWLIKLTSGKPADLHVKFKFKDISTKMLEEPGDAVTPPVAAVKAA